jgi:hypothetical protein
LQQQPFLGANPDGPNLVAQTMNSIGKDLEKPQPYESCSPRAPTQGDIDTIAGAIEMLEGQNSVLSHTWTISSKIVIKGYLKLV